MTDVAFETKLKFFEPDSETASVICSVCGAVFDVSNNQRNHQTRCKECQDDTRRQRQNNKAYKYVADNTKTIGDPSLDLVLAVIRQAKIDRSRGWQAPIKDEEELNLKDCDPVEFLSDGAELWLRCAGVTVDYDTERGLAKLTDKRNNRKRKPCVIQ